MNGNLNLEELFAEYKGENSVRSVEILELDEGYAHLTAYNPTPLNEEYVLARVEPIDKEYPSEVMFCKEKGGKLYPQENMPVLKNFQDPFTTKVEGKPIIGCVEVTSLNSDKNYKTVFLDGENLEKIAEGPQGMKCLRVFDLPNGEIGVFTRPQGGGFGKGKIGYTTVDSLKELEKKNLLEAELVEGIIPENCWGGVNAVYCFDDELGVLGHIATSQVEKGIDYKTYYAMAFKFDFNKEEPYDFKIILDRKSLPKTKMKREGLGNIVYPGGLRDIKEDYSTLYAGISDAATGKISMKNPFN